MTTDSAFEAWKQRAASASVFDVAGRLGAKLGKGKVERVGPCPRCGGTDRFSVNSRKRVFNCRGAEGGDVIAMVRHVLGLDFIAACEWIIGEPPPGRGTTLTEEQERAAEQARAAAADAEAKREADNDAFRERERGILYDIWRRAAVDAGELADYLALRLGPRWRDIPAVARPRLRLVRDMPYYRQGADRGEILAHAPAMIAPMIDAAGIFRALHFTYLDLSTPNGKLRLTDPDAAGELLPAKKMRGSKGGRWIDLFPRRADEAPARKLVLGEGIEKTLAVWLALSLAGRDLAEWAFWVAADLGNLAGKAAASMAHPTLRHASGRPVRIAGIEPDPVARAIVVPDQVDDVILLGDTTSDPFTTRCALARATRRYAREGRTVRVAWAPEGVDFDDILRMAA